LLELTGASENDPPILGVREPPSQTKSNLSATEIILSLVY
jgi:hypothetical protein